MTRLLQHKKGLFAILFVLMLNALGATKGYAYMFTAQCSTGQTLYFNITDATSRIVEITYPGTSTDPWGNWTKPTGDISLPTTVTLGGYNYTVRAIGEKAFYGCSGLTGNLFIPSTVHEIGNNAFYGCSGFTGSLAISPGVTSIGARAFGYCTGFQVVSYGAENCADVTTDDKPFASCTGALYILADVQRMPANIFLWASFNQVYYNAINCADATPDDVPFRGCGSQSLNIGSNVQRIPAYMFYDAITFKGSLTIPNSVTSIGNGAFENCTGFYGSLSLGNSLTEIGNAAFSGTRFTGSLIIPNSVTTIGDFAFAGCSSFNSFLRLGTGVTTIGVHAFDGCTGFISTLNIGNSVTTIGNYAFYNCTGFAGMSSMPASVTTIGTHAFEGCTGFTGTLYIGYNVTSIGQSAFKGCTGIDHIEYQASNCADLTASAQPFEDCGDCTLTIGDYVERIPANLFRECYSLTGGLTIPNSVTSIGDNAFDYCTGFDGGLSIGTGVTTIGDEAFYGCSGFWGTLHVGNSVTTIGAHAFDGCSGFGSVMITRSVTTIGNYAFNGCSGCDNVDIDNICHNLTSIGNNAFKGCSGLIRVDYIGSFSDWCGISFGDAYSNPLFYAHNLYKNVGTTSVNYQLVSHMAIPEGVTVIKQYAFERATCLTALTIPSSVTSIESAAFNNCTGLITMTAHPETPPTLGQNVFYNVPTTIPVYVPCESYSAYHNASGWSSFTNMHTNACDPLTYSINPDGVSVTVTGHVEGTAATGELYIPATKTIDGVTYTVTAIAKNAFYSHTGLTGSLAIPNTVTSIGQNAFRSCTGLTGSLSLGNSLTSIGPDAFTNCQFTGSLTIPNSVTEIGSYAFGYCSGFNGTLTIGTGVTSIGLHAFKGCTGFTQVCYNAINCADVTDQHMPFEGCGGTLTIGDSVQSIPAYMFYQCQGFTGSLTIPDSVTTIGENAFYECVNFTGSLTIGSSVTTIGANAFYECVAFSGELIIPNSVTTIGVNAFYYCLGLTSLTIGEGVTSIGASAFKNCTGFTQVNYNAVNCDDLSSSTKPFEDCTAFTLNIGNSVQRIPANLFRGCYSLTGGLTIPNSVTSIGNGAFRDCTGLTGSLDIPESVTSLGNSAFYNCHGFTGTLTLPNSLTEISTSVFENCYGFHGFLTIPNSVTMIYDNAFAYCAGFMGSLTIPNSVTYIGSHAFESCDGMTGMLTIGSSVTVIAGYAFGGCIHLSSMTVYPQTPPELSPYVFQNVPSGIPVYVPCSSLEAYQEGDSYWNYFTNMQCIPEPILTVYDGTNNSRMVPAYMYYFDDFTRSQFVIPAADLAQMNGNTINTIKFYVNSQTNSSAIPYTSLSTVDVYLKEVNYTTISDFEPKENATIVYQGKLEVVADRDDIGTMTITLTEPFDYHGDNLLIGIENITDFEYKNIYFTGATVSGASVAGSHSASLSAVTPSQQNFIPKTTFTYELTSSCPKINTITFSEIDPTYALMEWNGGSGIYNVEYKKASDEEWTTRIAEYNGNTVEFINLEPATNYLVRVQSVCGDEVSTWKAASFTTPCQVISSYPWFTDFDSYTGTTVGSTNNLPMCWHYINMSTSSNYAGHPVIFTQNQYAYSGDNYLRFYSYASADPQDQYAILPEMEGLNGKQIRLYARGYQSGNAFKIGMMTDPTDASTFVEIATQTLTTTYEEYVYPLGVGNHVAIMMEAAVSGTVGVFIDDITIEESEACTAPNNLEVAEIAEHNAKFTWDGNAESYSLELENISNGSMEIFDFVTSPIYLWLESGTTYDVRVRAICSEIGPGEYTYSDYSNTVTFTSLCEVIIVDATNPFTEDFEGTNFAPNCWESIPSDSHHWTSSIGQSHSSSHSAFSSWYGDIYLVLPDILLSASASSAQLTFWSYNTYPQDFEVGNNMVVLLNGGTETVLWSAGTVQTEWVQTTVDLTSYIGQTVSLAFKYAGDNDNGWYVDDVEVSVVEPLCPPEDRCELTFELSDSYGDGWNGAAINVVDVETNTLLASMSASDHGLSDTTTTDTYTLAVCDGRELRFEWVSGGWDIECSYTVTDINGDTIFSGTGAMSAPVTYMVDCGVAVQTVTLSAGWNWVSTNVDITLDDLKAALVAALPSATTIKIYAQNGDNTSYLGNNNWRGSLTQLDLSQMYLVQTNVAGELTLSGNPVNPTDHPVTITNGVNYFGFPLSTSMALSDAFNGFAQTGDKVLSQEGQSSYLGNNRWRGDVSALEPGKGYIFLSESSEVRTLVFPSSNTKPTQNQGK